MGKITRRVLLGSVATIVAGGAVYGGSRFACRFVPRHHPDFFSLLDMTPDNPATRRIGELVVAEAASAGFDAFAAALRLRPLTGEAATTDCESTRRRLVQDQCAIDFAEGRSVVIDGWVLSETEANLYAAKLLRPSIA
ncbi:hypothetical protein ACFSCV_03105 [Methylopila henanensis]|uniref:Uncharacterized protein n=1 Tax=Methylopila henanensis TaxID=873516 RepID=A0ABW4K5X3_9HYPH